MMKSWFRSVVRRALLMVWIMSSAAVVLPFTLVTSFQTPVRSGPSHSLVLTNGLRILRPPASPTFYSAGERHIGSDTGLWMGQNTDPERKSDEKIEATDSSSPNSPSTRVRLMSRIKNPFRNRIESSIDASSSSLTETDGETDDVSSITKPVAVVMEQQPKEEDDPMAYVASLKAQAERARLEAEKMDAMLTLQKIAKLEARLEKNPKPEEAADLKLQMDLLKNKLNPPVVRPTSSSSTTSNNDPSVESQESFKSLSSSKREKEGANLMETIPPPSAELLQEESKVFLSQPKVLRDMTALSLGFEDDSNVTAIVECIYYEDKKSKQTLVPTTISGVSKEKWADAKEGFELLPDPIRLMMAKSVGLEDSSNTTLVLEKLEAEGKLFNDDKGMEGFTVDQTMMNEIFNGNNIAMENYVESLLPKVTRKEGQTPSDEDVDRFFTEVLGKDTFNARAKPERVPGGFIIRGETRAQRSDDEGPSGDALVAALDARAAKVCPDVMERIQFYYIKDPTPQSQDIVEVEDFERPVILITGADLTPETNRFVKPNVNGLSLVAVAAFALGSFSFNDDFMARLNAMSEAGDTDISWLTQLAAPLFFSSLGIQLSHEMAHKVVALKDNFKIGLPTLIPSLNIGLTGSITPITTPPKNFKSLFDFALAGPMIGLLASVIFLYSGLELTVFMDPVAQAQLPRMPVELLQSSSLGAGMIQWLLGSGILLAPDPATATVSLHPFAIAGYAGIIINALALLPIGSKFYFTQSLHSCHDVVCDTPSCF